MLTNETIDKISQISLELIRIHEFAWRLTNRVSSFHTSTEQNYTYKFDRGEKWFDLMDENDKCIICVRSELTDRNKERDLDIYMPSSYICISRTDGIFISSSGLNYLNKVYIDMDDEEEYYVTTHDPEFLDIPDDDVLDETLFQYSLIHNACVIDAIKFCKNLSPKLPLTKYIKLEPEIFKEQDWDGLLLKLKSITEENICTIGD